MTPGRLRAERVVIAAAGSLLVAFLAVPVLALFVTITGADLGAGLRASARLARASTEPPNDDREPLVVVAVSGTPLAWTLARARGAERRARSRRSCSSRSSCRRPSPASRCCSRSVAAGCFGLALPRGLVGHVHDGGGRDRRGLRLGAVLRAGGDERVSPHRPARSSSSRGASVPRRSACSFVSSCRSRARVSSPARP